MTDNKEIYIVRERNTVIAVTSNLMTAYKCMMYVIPDMLKTRVKSYHQINRIFKRSAFVEFPIPDRDWFYIERQKVYASLTDDWVGSAGVQPTRLRPNDRCGTLAQRG